MKYYRLGGVAPERPLAVTASLALEKRYLWNVKQQGGISEELMWQ